MKRVTRRGRTRGHADAPAEDEIGRDQENENEMNLKEQRLLEAAGIDHKTALGMSEEERKGIMKAILESTGHVEEDLESMPEQSKGKDMTDEPERSGIASELPKDASTSIGQTEQRSEEAEKEDSGMARKDKKKAAVQIIEEIKQLDDQVQESKSERKRVKVNRSKEAMEWRRSSKVKKQWNWSPSEEFKQDDEREAMKHKEKNKEEEQEKSDEKDAFDGTVETFLEGEFSEIRTSGQAFPEQAAEEREAEDVDTDMMLLKNIKRSKRRAKQKKRKMTIESDNEDVEEAEDAPLSNNAGSDIDVMSKPVATPATILENVKENRGRAKQGQGRKMTIESDNEDIETAGDTSLSNNAGSDTGPMSKPVASPATILKNVRECRERAKQKKRKMTIESDDEDIEEAVDATLSKDAESVVISKSVASRATILKNVNETRRTKQGQGRKMTIESDDEDIETAGDTTLSNDAGSDTDVMSKPVATPPTILKNVNERRAKQGQGRKIIESDDEDVETAGDTTLSNDAGSDTDVMSKPVASPATILKNKIEEVVYSAYGGCEKVEDKSVGPGVTEIPDSSSENEASCASGQFLLDDQETQAPDDFGLTRETDMDSDDMNLAGDVDDKRGCSGQDQDTTLQKDQEECMSQTLQPSIEIGQKTQAYDLQQPVVLASNTDSEESDLEEVSLIQEVPDSQTVCETQWSVLSPTAESQAEKLSQAKQQWADKSSCKVSQTDVREAVSSDEMSGHNNSSLKISRWPPYHLPVEVAVDPKRYAPVIKLMFDIYLCRLHRAQRRRPGPPPVWGKPVKAGNHEQDCLKVKPKRRGREHFQRVLKASKDQEKEDAHSNEGAITEENDLLASEGGYYDEPVDVRNRKKIVGVCTYDKSALELNTDKCTGNGKFEFHGSSSDVEQKEVPARKGLRHRATTSRGVRYKESSSLGEQESEVERKIHKEKSPDSEWRPESKKRSSQEGPLFKGIRNKSKRGKRRQPKDIHDKEEESNGRGGKRRQRNADLDDDEVNYGKEGKGLLSKVDNDGDEDIPQQQQVDVMEWLSTKKAIKTYERVRPKKPKTQAWRMRLYGRLNRKHAKEGHESLDDSDEVVEMNEEIEEVTKNSIAAEHVTHKDVSFALSDEDRFATDEILASKRRKGSLGRIEFHEPPKKDENEIKESGRDKSNISKDEFTAVDNVLVLDNDMISLRDKDELKLASLVTGEATRGGEEITSSSQGASGSGVPNSQSSNYMIDMNGDMYCTQVAHRTRTAQCNKNLEQAVKKQPAVKQKGGKGRLKDNVPIKVASGEDSDSRSASGSSKELNEEVVLEKDSSDSKLVPVVNLEDSYPNDKNHASKPEIRTVTVPELDASTEEKHQSNKGLSTRKRKLLSAEGTFVTAEVQPTEGTDAAIGREKRPRQMHHQMVSLTEPETPVRSVRARRIDRKTEVVSGLGDNTDVEEKVSKGPVENVEAENVLGPSTSAAEDCQVQQAIMFSEQEMSKDEGWCPLCNKMFPQKDLEEHASTCGEEPAPEPLHERCMVCNAEVATGKMRVHQIHCSKEFSAVSPARVTRHRTANQPTTSSDDVALVFASNKD